MRRAEWTARSDRPRRSVFGNYRPAKAENDADGRGRSAARDASSAAAPAPRANSQLQAAIDAALARAFVHRFLAQAFADPTPAGWATLTTPEALQTLHTAVNALHTDTPALTTAAQALAAGLDAGAFESFHSAYLAAFGHAARGTCPLNEIEYGDIKADPLFQPHRLADLSAFYRAFGLEVAEDATERHDHICLELEFMCVLAAKEAYALEHQLDGAELAICRDAQRKFLREHLGRWTPAFTRRLAALAGDTPLGVLAGFTRTFVEAECGRLGVTAGSEDLLLRPVDEASESLCASCGLAEILPGSAAPDGAEGQTARGTSP